MVGTALKTFLPCLAAVLTALPLTGAETQIARSASPPVIDGRGDDAAWQAQPWHGGFVMLGESSRKPAAQTRFKAVHDGDRICFLIRADEPVMRDLRTVRTARDSDVWNDDCAEILIDPNRSQDRFYHFAVSAAGVIFDEERLQGGLVTSAGWNCRDVTAAATKGENWWQVEIAIPLVALGLERTDGNYSSTGTCHIMVTHKIRVIFENCIVSFSVFTAFQSKSTHISFKPDHPPVAEFNAVSERFVIKRGIRLSFFFVYIITVRILHHDSISCNIGSDFSVNGDCPRRIIFFAVIVILLHRFIVPV